MVLQYFFLFQMVVILKTSNPNFIFSDRPPAHFFLSKYIQLDRLGARANVIFTFTLVISTEIIWIPPPTTFYK